MRDITQYLIAAPAAAFAGRLLGVNAPGRRIGKLKLAHRTTFMGAYERRVRAYEQESERMSEESSWGGEDFFDACLS